MRLPQAGEIEIVPSVLACDFGRLAAEIAEVETAGGISARTAIEVVRCGADTLVVGSAIFQKSNRAEAIDEILAAIEYSGN